MAAAFTAAELEARLNEFLDPVLSIRRSAAPLAHALSAAAPTHQGFALHWVEVIARTNPEMAYQFAAHAPAAFARMALTDVEGWIIEAMDTYDKLGMYPAIAVLKDVERFAATAAENTRGVSFDDVAGILELFVRGLAGRPLKLAAADEIYTDTATLFLPRRLSLLPTREENFRLYKCIAAHLWAQTRFGTFRMSLRQAARGFADPDKAVRQFHALETIRLEACIARELPGLHRDLAALRPHGHPPHWARHVERLAGRDASVQDTYEALRTAYSDEVPPALCYQGLLFPERVETAAALRQAQEKESLRAALAQLLPDKAAAGEGPVRFTASQRPDPEDPARQTFELNLDGQALVPPADVQALMASIAQDLGRIPEDYLVAAGAGGERQDPHNKGPADATRQADRDDGAVVYNEWDYRRQHYRKDWCMLREIDVHPLDEPFVERTLRKYAGLAARLRKTFEALRGENKLQRRQTHGDEIDFDAVVAAHADLKCGREFSDRLFVQSHRIERNIAVMFMVDMSGSTKGWINDAERESLILLCEALEILGDRYAIYGFSGITRKRCELYRVKRFDEPYGQLVKRRITGIKPQDYTRMGVAIRHLTKLLGEIDARTKLLITLSDGKPDDYDGYRGDYGIEDTRQALLEARMAGVHPFCITIDTEAREYLPHMYGAANYVLIDDVRKLPHKVSDIYRRLTA